MSSLPEVGLVRIHQIIGDPEANPPVAPLIPVGASSWWAGVKSGKYPQPIKLGPRTTCWRISDIRKLIEQNEKG
jgi:prophage regulatory protein